MKKKKKVFPVKEYMFNNNNLPTVFKGVQIEISY